MIPSELTRYRLPVRGRVLLHIFRSIHCTIRLNLPSGLEEALESLAREVLRQKPQNIYEFAADHFEELVKKRNECKYYHTPEHLFYQ